MTGVPAQATILINNYNYGQYLREAIDSALAQDYPQTEVIVVDDASSDGSRAIIESYGDRIRAIFHDSNRGQSAAFNSGVEAARGELIFMLDADDVFRPNKVSRVMAAFAAHPDAAMVIHRLPNASPDLGKVGKGFPMPPLGDIRAEVIRMHGMWRWNATTSMAVPKRVFDIVKPLPAVPSGAYADVLLALLVPLFGPVIGLDEPLALRRLHTENLYSHPERQAQAEWTLREDLELLRDNTEAVNGVLERLGHEVRYDFDRQPATINMRYVLGEASAWQVVRSGLRLWRWRSPGELRREIAGTLRRSRQTRRRMRKARGQTGEASVNR